MVSRGTKMKAMGHGVPPATGGGGSGSGWQDEVESSIMAACSNSLGPGVFECRLTPRWSDFTKLLLLISAGIFSYDLHWLLKQPMHETE